MSTPLPAPPSLALPAELRWAGLLGYGLFALPLAMVALPIYVLVPQFYAGRGGLTLGATGGVLLAARLLAAFSDPLLGRWIGRGGAYARYVALSLPLLLGGFAALFHPPAGGGAALLLWFLGALLLVYLGFGLATIAHQSWGAALTQQPGARARVTAAREACGLLGVLLAAGLAGSAGYGALTLAFGAALLACAALLLLRAPRPARAPPSGQAPSGQAPDAAFGLLAPLQNSRFRALFAVLLVNGVAAAIPATLFLFFVQDRLRLAPYAGLFLMLYFGAAALSTAGWAALARRAGEARAWAAGMLLSALVFVWAYGLAPGAAAGFGAICVLSGVALGADLVLPPALLAGVIARAGHSGAREASYFGLWNWGVHLNLALAAGIALPLLEWLGYTPGGAAGGAALAGAYALLPCVLKLAAAALLWRAPLHDC